MACVNKEKYIRDAMESKPDSAIGNSWTEVKANCFENANDFNTPDIYCAQDTPEITNVLNLSTYYNDPDPEKYDDGEDFDKITNGNEGDELNEEDEEKKFEE